MKTLTFCYHNQICLFWRYFLKLMEFWDILHLLSQINHNQLYKYDKYKLWLDEFLVWETNLCYSYMCTQWSVNRKLSYPTRLALSKSSGVQRLCTNMYPLKLQSICSEQGEWARGSEWKKALNPSRFAQSKKKNLWNSDQSEGSIICWEDIFPLDLLGAHF